MSVAPGAATRVPVAVSVLLADHVDGPDRTLEVLAAFPAALYLADPQDPSRTIAVVTCDAAVPPAALVLPVERDRAGLVGLARDASAGVGGGVVRIGPLRLVPSRWFDPRPRPPAGADPSAAARRLEGLLVTDAVARRVADAVADAVDARVGALRDALHLRDPVAAAGAGRELVGIGPGLTPSGDDVLAGLLATAAVLGRAGVDTRSGPVLGAVRSAVLDIAADRTTLLSASLLRDAVGGAMVSPAARLLLALLAPADRRDPSGTRAALADLLALGASSGRDLAEGMLLALRLAAGAGTAAAVTLEPAVPPSAALRSSILRPSDAPALVATDPWSPR